MFLTRPALRGLVATLALFLSRISPKGKSGSFQPLCRGLPPQSSFAITWSQRKSGLGISQLTGLNVVMRTITHLRSASISRRGSMDTDSKTGSLIIPERVAFSLGSSHRQPDWAGLVGMPSCSIRSGDPGFICGCWGPQHHLKNVLPPRLKRCAVNVINVWMRVLRGRLQKMGLKGCDAGPIEGNKVNMCLPGKSKCIIGA
jgi:hypothetical protein